MNQNAPRGRLLSSDAHRAWSSRHDTSVLRGRDAEVAAIERAFAYADRGESTVTIFSGDAGMGKTRLLGYAKDISESRGWPVMVVSPDQDASLTPFGALVEGATRSSPPLVTDEDIDPIVRSFASQYRISRLIADRLELATMRSGVLVIVDDLQWLDAGSLGSISSIITSLTGVPLVWMMSTRTGVFGPAHHRFLAKVANDQTLVSVSELDAEASYDMAVDALGGVPGPVVLTLLGRAGGIPLGIVELFQGLDEERLLQRVGSLIDVDTETFPARFGSSTRERLTNIGRESLRIIQVASLFGREFSLGAVLDVIGTSAAFSAPAVQELLDHGFLIDTGRGMAFRHDTVQSCALETLSPTLRRAMAREVLRKRLTSGDSISSLAATISSVAEAGDDESLELLFLAASQLSVSDAQGAADLVVLGADLNGDRAVHAEWIASMLPLVVAGGRAQDALRISATLAPRLTVDARARVSLALSRQLTESDFVRAIRVASEALSLPGISQATRVQLLSVRALNMANIADEEGLRRSLDEARCVADEGRDVEALATLDATESVSVFYRGLHSEAIRLQRQALARAESAGLGPTEWLPERLWMSFMLNSMGDCHDALKIANDGVEDALAAHNVIAETYWMMVRTRCLYDLGMLDEARTQAETVLAAADDLELGDFTNATVSAVLHKVALHTGDIATRDGIRPLLERLSQSEGLKRTGNWNLALEAMYRGNSENAHHHASLALNSLHESTPSTTTPTDFADALILARICYAVGDNTKLDEVVDASYRRAARNPDNALGKASALATRGIRDRSYSDMLEAAELLAPIRRPLVRAAVLECAAELADDRAAAISALTAALQIYDDCGALGDSRRVLRALRALGVHRRLSARRQDPSGLSEREMQVVERIRAGLTTQLIADDLLVSPHTVVTHIRHIYAKWGVNSRKAVIARAQLED